MSSHVLYKSQFPNSPFRHPEPTFLITVESQTPSILASDWPRQITLPCYWLLISPSCFRKLREEYDKLEGALKKLGVDPECVVTEEEDGYNAESDLEEDTEQDCDRGETTTFIPAVYTVDASHRGLARVDEVNKMMIRLRVFFTLVD